MLPPASLWIVVDRERRIIDGAMDRDGDVVAGGDWFEDALLDVIERAERGPGVVRSAVRDRASGTHWMFDAEHIGSDPWQTRVMAVDATLAVQSDRSEILAKVAHTTGNSLCAIQAILDIVDADPLDDDELRDCLVHLRSPTQRLARTMDRLMRHLQPPTPAKIQIAVDDLLSAAVTQAEPACRPTAVEGVPEATALVDPDMIIPSIVALLESGGARSHPRLAAVAGEQGEVRIVVTRKLRSKEVPGDLWDLAGDASFDQALALASARESLRLHGGSVDSRESPAGTLQLTLCLPRR